MANSLELLLGRRDHSRAYHTPDLASESFCAAHEPQICTYPHIKNDTLDENELLERGLPLSNPSDRSLSPRFDLGDLDELPSELLDEILAQVDLDSLSRFRGVNQRALQTVDCLPQYRAIVQHSPQLLRGVLATGIGASISCQKVLETLETALCEVCRDFAGFVYLPTCSRVCALCFSNQDDYYPLLAMEVKLSYDIDPDLFASVPRMLTLPDYTMGAFESQGRMVVYDHGSARQAAITHFGSLEAMQRRADSLRRERGALYEEQYKRWERKGRPVGRQPRRLPEAPEDHPRRFLGIVRAPWLDPRTKQIFWGFHCSGCRDDVYMNTELHWRRMYSADTFDKHIRDWGPVELYQARSDREWSKYRHRILAAGRA